MWKRKQLKCALLLHPRTYVPDFKGKVKDVSESNFDELLAPLGSKELCVDVGVCEDQDSSKKSSFDSNRKELAGHGKM